MNIKLLFLLGTVFCVSKLNAWEGGYMLGARSVALGNCGLSTKDLWAVSNNPALLPFQNKNSVGITVQNRFGVSNLNAGAIAANFVNDYGAMGFYTYSFGNSAYYEYSSGLSFAKLLTRDFAAGITLYYTGLVVREYGNFGAPAFNLGFSFPFNEKFSGVFKINNPTRSKIAGIENERTQSSAALGINHQVATHTTLYVEGEVYQKYPMDFRCGFEYSPQKDVAVRAGFSTHRRSVSFGFSYEKSFKFVVGLSYHSRLGFSSTFDSQFYFGKTTEK